MIQDWDFRLGIKHRLSILEDRETGVEYLVVYRGETGCCICPRYNADGSLYNSKKRWR